MGTSTSFTGLTGGGWTQAKRLATRYARSGGDREALTRAVGAYVAAHGGALLAAAGAAAGQAALSALGSFLTDVARSGLSDALEKRGMTHLVGQDADTVLASLVDALAGPGNTREDAIARAAMTEVLGELFERLAETPEGLAELDRLDRQGVTELMAMFTVEYVYLRMLEEIGDRIAAGATTPEVAQRLEIQIKDYIKEMLEMELRNIDPMSIDWGGPDGQAFRQRIFESAYALLEE